LAGIEERPKQARKAPAGWPLVDIDGGPMRFRPPNGRDYETTRTSCVDRGGVTLRTFSDRSAAWLYDPAKVKTRARLAGFWPANNSPMRVA
jgi:hypothetical protein